MKDNNLIVRLKNILARTFAKGKVARRIATLAIASAVSVGAMSGCFTTTNNGNTPGGNGDQTQTTKYSALLEDVLKDENYNKLIDKLNADDKQIATGNYFEPHPYAFLSKQGHNVSDIKDNKLKCFTTTYTIGNDKNNLYITTRVENKSSTPYYSCYLLKYSLTNQEYDDLKMLHEKQYYQTPLFIQKLSEKKTSSVEYNTKITIDAYDELLNNLRKYTELTTDLFGTKNIELDFLNFSIDKQTFNIAIRNPIMYENKMYKNAKLKNLSLHPSEVSGKSISAINNAFNWPTYYWYVDRNDVANLKNLTDITYFHSQGLINKFDLDVRKEV